MPIALERCYEKGSMAPEELKKKLESLAPGTTAEVVDLTGTQDHYQASIVSPAFEGKSTLDCHQIVMDFMKADIDSGEVHALSLKTSSPKG